VVSRDWAMSEYCPAWVSCFEQWSRAWMAMRVYFSRTRPNPPRRPIPSTRELANSHDLQVIRMVETRTPDGILTQE
jgi:hypothetical protein